MTGTPGLSLHAWCWECATPYAIPVLVEDVDISGLSGNRSPPGAMRFRVIGVEPLGLGIDDDVAGPVRVRVEEVDPVRSDHELRAEQKARSGAEDEANQSMRHCPIPFIDRGLEYRLHLVGQAGD